MRNTATLFLLLLPYFIIAQKSSLSFELNGRASHQEIVEGKKNSKNPFKRFIGEWQLKEDRWEQNWGGETEVIHIPHHHTTSYQVNTECSLLSIIDGPEPNGHIFWSYNPETQEVFHSSTFGSKRTGIGKGSIAENGDLQLKVAFADEAEGSYRRYRYRWIDENEYELTSYQYDAEDRKTGLFYAGNFRRITPSVQDQKTSFSQKLNSIHQQFIQAAQKNNPELILDYYDDSTLFIAEFHPLIMGRANIKAYYEEIFQRQEISSYQRDTKDLIFFDDRLVTWGTFELDFLQNSQQPFNLVGKFMQVWQIKEKGDWVLRSEQWNYDHKIEEGLDLEVAIDGLPLRYKTPASKRIDANLTYELDAYYALGANAVRKRDPYGRLNSFHPDGVFLAPHGETAKIGYEELKAYLIDYNAGEVKIDSIEVGLNHVEDYGKYLIKNNYYYVKASGDGWVYEGQGMGTDLMKRNEKGQLKRLWQIGTEQPVVSTLPLADLDRFEEASVQSLLEADAALRSIFYTKESFLMAEYQKVLKEGDHIEQYYQAFLTRYKVTNYKKERIEVLDLGGWILETGRFQMELSSRSGASHESYEGKYQNLWRLEEKGDWKIFAEAWNYSHQVEDWESLSFPELGSYNHLGSTVEGIPLEILGLNKISEEIISQHDAKRWAQLYDEAGMLLYSHSPFYQGKKAISAHLVEHVKGLPTFNRLDIGTFFIEELDEYIIELGNHEVDWSYGDRQGISRGKNIRIWKKYPNASMKIYRQAAMYDLRD
ncbi:MAG: nuclear transport factor 2 family protein [Bacteroidota bacterium]